MYYSLKTWGQQLNFIDLNSTDFVGFYENKLPRCIWQPAWHNLFRYFVNIKRHAFLNFLLSVVIQFHSFITTVEFSFPMYQFFVEIVRERDFKDASISEA